MKMLNDIASNLNWIEILKFESNIKRNLVLCNRKKQWLEVFNDILNDYNHKI
jgi:hypothetical protein